MYSPVFGISFAEKVLLTKGDDMRFFVTVTALTMLFALTGCGEQPVPETEAADDSVTQQEDTPVTGNGIILPDGWAMTDAVSASEVEAIMGTPGFDVFPEAASSASSGRPIGSYNVSSVPYSKVRFEADVNGGQEAYDTAAGFLSDPTEITGPNWDSAVIGEVAAGERTQVRIVVLKGDLCFIVSWEPDVFPDLDRIETSVKLADLLTANLYGL